MILRVLLSFLYLFSSSSKAHQEPNAAGWSGVRGGGLWRSAGIDIRGGSVILGRKIGVPGQYLARNVLYACFVVDFIQLLHGVPVDTGILSLQEGRHSKEALQVGDHHLGHAWNLRQSRAPVGGPRCVMRCPSAPGESADAFHGRHLLLGHT
jgi:hypothetical protein